MLSMDIDEAFYIIDGHWETFYIIGGKKIKTNFAEFCVNVVLKTPISLGLSSVWSESSLGIRTFCLFCPVMAQISYCYVFLPQIYYT